MAPDDNRSMALTARNLAYLMNKRGADAATLCEVTGLGIATVNSLHRGIGNPTLSTLIGLAQFFNVSLIELSEMDLSAQNYKPSMARPIPLIKISAHNPCRRKIFIDGVNYLFSPIALDSDILPSIYKDYQILGVTLKTFKKFTFCKNT